MLTDASYNGWPNQHSVLSWPPSRELLDGACILKGLIFRVLTWSQPLPRGAINAPLTFSVGQSARTDFITQTLHGALNHCREQCSTAAGYPNQLGPYSSLLLA